jgi:hypothetical protein
MVQIDLGTEAKESTSFLKKRSKKLSTPGPCLSGKAEANVPKFFGSSFQKRTSLLST